MAWLLLHLAYLIWSILLLQLIVKQLFTAAEWKIGTLLENLIRLQRTSSSGWITTTDQSLLILSMWQNSSDYRMTEALQQLHPAPLITILYLFYWCSAWSTHLSRLKCKDLPRALLHKLTGYPSLLFLTNKERTCILNQLRQKPLSRAHSANSQRDINRTERKRWRQRSYSLSFSHFPSVFICLSPHFTS